MIKFPSLIEWIEDCGWKELHAYHEDFLITGVEKVSFDDFVQKEYESAKDEWFSTVNYRREIKFQMNEENDPGTESAKEILVMIINKGIKEGMVKDLILNDLACDSFTAEIIASEFGYIIDKVGEMLKKG